MRRSAATFAFIVVAACLPAQASEFAYSGPSLTVDYTGPVLIDNSHFLFTNQDAMTFETGEFLQSTAANLVPLTPAIQTWASMQGIHPRILIALLDAYWNGATTTNTKQEIEVVYDIAAGLAKVFWAEVDDPLAGTRAFLAVADTYGLRVELPGDVAVPRALPESSRAVNPFGYFQPPFPIGESWWGGGAHSNSGGSTNMNALDWAGRFSGWGTDYSDNWVSAMQSGSLYVYSECSIAIYHDDGWKTTYYHLENPQFPVGGPYAVTRNTPIANIANDEATALCQGGYSSGPHVHTAMWKDGAPEVVDESNLDFTAFNHHSSTDAYDWTCTTSYYNHYTLGTVCPGSLSLLNNAPAPIEWLFVDGFESGSTSAWSSVH